MTIFDIISDILTTKKKNLLNSFDEESEFQPFLVNRWLSMYSPQIALKCNIINKYLSTFDNKKDLYSLFCSVIPKSSFKKITYFKKKKQEPSENDEGQDTISKLAQFKELSRREIREYVNTLNTKPN